MLKKRGYKKYIKVEAQKRNSLLKIFILSFFGMLMVFTFIFKSFLPSVDTSIGEYVEDTIIENNEVTAKVDLDDRLSQIQKEDQGETFFKLEEDNKESREEELSEEDKRLEEVLLETSKEPVYKVLIGAYTSVEQAKVAKDIIEESGSGLNPIVKCLGSNNYTLQVGIFKNKQGADSLLQVVQQKHLPGRILEDY